MSLIAVSSLSGCVSVGPEYSPPQPRTPEHWQTPAGESERALSQWWLIFDDPLLEELVADVRSSNRDLASALARIEGLAAGYGIARAGLWPVLGAQAGTAWDRETERVRNPLETSAPDNPTGLYQAGFTMSWEIDLWGRIRSGMSAARGQWDASIEDMRNLLVILQARAASEYILLRTTQKRIDYAHENIELQHATLQIVRDRFDAGLTGELDLHQAQMNLASTRARMPSLLTQQTEALNALCLLTGRLPGELEQLAAGASIPTAGRLPGSIPADILRRRPDIRSSEISLAAQTAQIGIAKAEMLPKLSLDGSFAAVASETEALSDSNARKYSIGPALNWTMFSGGALRSRVEAEQAAVRAALADHEQTVLNAYRECEDALASYRNERDRLAELRKAVDAAAQSVELSKSLYVSGLVDFQNVLDMQRQLASYQDQLAYSEGTAAAALIAVYKAFGGGWELDI